MYFFQEEDNFFRGDFLFFSEEREISSDLSFDSSEVSFDSSEEFLLSSQGNSDFLGSYSGNSSGEIALVGGMYGLVVMSHPLARYRPF